MRYVARELENLKESLIGGPTTSTLTPTILELLHVRVKPQTEITITCKYNQQQKIIDHTGKNTRHQDLIWFTQSLGYIHQTKNPIFYDPVITICNPLQLNTAARTNFASQL